MSVESRVVKQVSFFLFSPRSLVGFLCQPTFFFFLHHHRASTSGLSKNCCSSSKVLRTDSGKSDFNRIGVFWKGEFFFKVLPCETLLFVLLDAFPTGFDGLPAIFLYDPLSIPSIVRLDFYGRFGFFFFFFRILNMG